MAVSLSLPRAGQGTSHLSLFFPFSPAYLLHAKEPGYAWGAEMSAHSNQSPHLNRLAQPSEPLALDRSSDCNSREPQIGTMHSFSINQGSFLLSEI